MELTDLQMWSLLVGSLMPPLVAIIQQPRWPDWFRAVVGVASSIVAGGVTTWLTYEDALWERPMVSAMLLVAVASWASYRNFWRPTNVSPTIEAKTTIP